MNTCESADTSPWITQEYPPYDPRFRQWLLDLNNWTEQQETPPETSHRLAIIGDLSGSYHNLIYNLFGLDIIDHEFNWKAWGTRLILLGDIFCDRNTESFTSMNKILELQDQARKYWGDVIVITGNHDMYAIEYLCGTRVVWLSTGNIFDELKYNNQGIGVVEFLAYFFHHEAVKKLENRDAVSSMVRNVAFDRAMGMYVEGRLPPRQCVLTSLREDKEWRKILEALTNMKIIYRINDVLFTHTNVTNHMAQILLDSGMFIEGLNMIFQGVLRHILLDESLEDGSHMEHFRTLVQNFLDVNNRENKYLSPELAQKLYDQGIRVIVHGHDGMGVKGTSIWPLRLYSADKKWWLDSMLKVSRLNQKTIILLPEVNNTRAIVKFILDRAGS